MQGLSGRPSLEQLVDELRPLDVVWDDGRELAGIVIACTTPSVIEALLSDAPARGEVHSVWFLGDERVRGVELAMPRVRSPEHLRPAIARILDAATEPADRSPVAFDFHVVSRAEAPSLWRLLAVFRDRSADLAGVDVVRTFLWAAYLSIVGVRDQRTVQSVRHHVAKAARAIADMSMQTNPVLSILGEAAAYDLEAAVVDRARADGELVVEKLVAALARASTPTVAARARRSSTVGWMRVRNTFEAFPAALERVERELDAKYSTSGYRALT